MSKLGQHVRNCWAEPIPQGGSFVGEASLGNLDFIDGDRALLSKDELKNQHQTAPLLPHR